jgi:transcription elongation GreA/GreB family factor
MVSNFTDIVQVKVSTLKQQLIDHCRAFATTRIEEARKNITTLQSSANEEMKSSVGDKYETGRAMIQIEIGNLAVQLAESQKMLKAIETIKDHPADRVHPGAVVFTSQGNYFIAISAGLVTIENENYVTVSAISPIGAKLSGLKAGDAFVFNKKDVKVLKVL